MKKDKQTIGDRIREIRGKVSQKEFASLLGIGKTTIFNYEKDERMPDAEFLIKLNVLYNVQPLWLLTGQGQDVTGEKLSPAESRLLSYYRRAPLQTREALMHLAQSVATELSSDESFTISVSKSS